MNSNTHPEAALVRTPRVLSLAMVALVLSALPGCAVVGDIFKAGMWVGILAIVGLVVVVGGLFSLFRKK